MDRRKFIYTSGVLTTGLIIPPHLLKANPILSFFARLGGAVLMNLLSEGITSWIKSTFFEDDFKESVVNHTTNLNNQGFITQPMVYHNENYFVYPTIKNSNDRLRAPFFYAGHNMNSIIDMNHTEFGHLTSIADKLIKKEKLKGSDLRNSLMPLNILDRATLNKDGLKYIVYNSLNNGEVRYFSTTGNNGYFIIDGPFGKTAMPYNCPCTL